MQIVYKKIDDLIPYKNNPRINDEAVKYVANSIKEFGFKVPIIIDKDDVIIAGHTRYKASKELDLKEVPCIIADDLSEEQVKAFRLADNKVSEYSTWNDDLLNIELEDLNMDMEQFGFDLDLGMEEEQEIIEDEVPEVPEEPKAKLGDIYQLGNHRLMCGSALVEEDVAKLMNGIKADMVFTDPPYGMKKENDGVANDNLNYDDLLEFNKKWIPITFKYLKDNGSWYCWGIDEPLMDIYSNILKPMQKQNKITFRNLITWDKGSGQGQLNPEYKCYPMADEKCLFVMCGIQNLILNSENYWVGYDKIRNYLKGEADKVNLTPSLLKDICGVGMWGHVTPKPIALCTRAIKSSSRENENVLDVFGGSGSTLIACEQNNRNCYVMELEPKWVDVIIQRWENFTGKKAVKIN